MVILSLLNQLEGIHFLARSLIPLFYHEACDSNCDLFIWVTTSKFENVLLKDEIFGTKDLLLDISAKLLWLSNTILIL